MNRIPFAALVAALTLAVATPARAQSDVVISQRLVPVCNPQGTTPYLYFNSTDGKWHCTATAPKVVLGGDTGTPFATAVGGVTDASSTASGTTQNTEYVLNSVTIKAKSFNANGRAIRCEAWGSTAANANAKNIKFYFGSTAVVTVTGSTANAKDYHGEMNIVRTAASTQTGQALIQVDTATSPSMAVAAPTETDTADIVISVKSANTAAAAASATGKGLSCYFIN